MDVSDLENLPIDQWEMSPNNIVMDETTFFACGNFGEVYKAALSGPVSIPGYTSQEVMSPVAVKLLQGQSNYLK